MNFLYNKIYVNFYYIEKMCYKYLFFYINLEIKLINKINKMLYIVPTPIGNLEDFTFRALRILNEVDLILIENYKTSKKLLNFYKIKTKTKCYHIYNEHCITNYILKRIEKGEKLALISSAGTPGISDPGYLLIRSCIQKFIPIECLPGPTALIPALVSSGFSINEFTFIGFLPKKKKIKNWKYYPKKIGQ